MILVELCRIKNSPRSWKGNLKAREDLIKLKTWIIIHLFLLLTGMLHGIYHGIGHGLGRVIGGFLFSTLGAQATFTIFGCLGITMLIMFAAVNKIFQNVRTK